MKEICIKLENEAEEKLDYLRKKCINITEVVKQAILDYQVAKL